MIGHNNQGFTLPSVLIVGLVMLAAFVATLQSVVTYRTSLEAQHNTELARQAAESGLERAAACIETNNSAVLWDDASPLRPSGDCTGASECQSEDCYLVYGDSVRSRFVVSEPLTENGVLNVRSVGVVELLRSGTDDVWRSFEYVAKSQVTIGSEVGFEQIDAGSSFTCTVAMEGNVYCWGQGTYGRLGNNDPEEVDQYTPVAVYSDGTLEGKSITELSLGDNHACVLTAEDNHAYCWGRNNNGQIGDGGNVNRRLPTATAMTGSLTGKTVTHISAGYRHTCALASDGTAHCWGLNSNGQIGDGTTTSRSQPVEVDMSGSLAGKTVVQLSAGVDSTCAIDSDGAAYCWGRGSEGQLGNGQPSRQTRPVLVDMSGSLSGKEIIHIEAGGDTSRSRSFACALTSDSEVHCWGHGSYGRLGNGTNDVSHDRPVPIDTTGVLAGKTITQLDLGADHACVVTTDDLGYCWGRGSNGRLGNNASDTRPSADEIDMSGALDGLGVAYVVAGDNHTCAIASDATGYCWGVDTNGRLGHGGPLGAHQFTPAPVASLPIPVVPTIRVYF